MGDGSGSWLLDHDHDRDDLACPTELPEAYNLLLDAAAAAATNILDAASPLLLLPDARGCSC